MSDQSSLADFWRANEAPARDLAFALAVEERIARRRMQIDLAAGLGAAVAIVASLAVLWPTLLPLAVSLVDSFDAAGPALAATAVLGGAMVWLTSRPQEA